MSKVSLTLRETAFLLLVTDLMDYINGLICPPHASASTPLSESPHVLNCASPLPGNTFTCPDRNAGKSAF